MGIILAMAMASEIPSLSPVCDANTGKEYSNESAFLAAQEHDPSLKLGICPVKGNEKCDNNNLNYYVCGYIWYNTVEEFKVATKDKHITLEQVDIARCEHPTSRGGVCGYIFYSNLCAFNHAVMNEEVTLNQAECPAEWSE